MVQIRPPLTDHNLGEVSSPVLRVPIYRMKLTTTPALWTASALSGAKALGIKSIIDITVSLLSLSPYRDS